MFFSEQLIDLFALLPSATFLTCLAVGMGIATLKKKPGDVGVKESESIEIDVFFSWESIPPFFALVMRSVWGS